MCVFAFVCGHVREHLRVRRYYCSEDFFLLSLEDSKIERY